MMKSGLVLSEGWFISKQFAAVFIVNGYNNGLFVGLIPKKVLLFCLFLSFPVCIPLL